VAVVVFSPAPVPRRGSGAVDRPAARAVGIIDSPDRTEPIHLMYHCRDIWILQECSSKTAGRADNTSTDNYRRIARPRNLLPHNVVPNMEEST
jgi:hypothetical protein